jgi:hypothetical protein
MTILKTGGNALRINLIQPPMVGFLDKLEEQVNTLFVGAVATREAYQELLLLVFSYLTLTRRNIWLE